MAKIKRIYQRIDEFSIEDNYEFYSEQDMIDAGWAEYLCFSWAPQIKHQCID